MFIFLPILSLKFRVLSNTNRDVRCVGIFSLLRHKLLIISVFKEILHCKAVCDVNSRIDPCLSHHGRGLCGKEKRNLGDDGDICLLWMGRFILGTKDIYV